MGDIVYPGRRRNGLPWAEFSQAFGLKTEEVLSKRSNNKYDPLLNYFGVLSV